MWEEEEQICYNRTDVLALVIGTSSLLTIANTVTNLAWPDVWSGNKRCLNSAHLCVLCVLRPEVLVQVLADPGRHLEHPEEDEEGAQQDGQALQHYLGHVGDVALLEEDEGEGPPPQHEIHAAPSVHSCECCSRAH